MLIEPGQELLHYRLIGKIGEGGMGVVWKAVDTNLDREVAIKTLPAGFADDHERLVRFEREAKLLASLNHPNVAAIYGIHQTEDAPFIAMELVPGEDLAARIGQGPLDLTEALGIARKIAAALAAAHDNGVVHRDLKPANIRITPENEVKVLDFGLAKALDAGSSPDNLSHSPTLTSAGTRVGVILGTASYMSPEQARGKPVDRRADIWAFGCVLYEMLTGRQSFPGETVSDALAAILAREPDLDVLAGRVPRRVMRLLERCLNKDASKRLRDAGDIALELDAVLAGDTEVEEARPAARTSPVMIAAIAVVALLAGAGITWVARSGSSGADTAQREPRRLVVTTGDERPIESAAISRDGTGLFLTLEDGIHLRPLDRYELQPIPDSARASSAVESPDGRSLVFHDDDEQILGGGKIRRTSLATMSTVVVRDLPDVLKPSGWGPRGIVALGDGGESLHLLSIESGKAERLYEVEQGHLHTASFIPNTNAILGYLHHRGGEILWSLRVIDPEAGTTTTLVENAHHGVVTANGYLLFLRDGTLIARRFDTGSLAAVGVPVPVVSQVRSFSVSDDGTLSYLPTAGEDRKVAVIAVSRDGTERVLYEGGALHIRYSPNGRWVSVIVRNGIDLIDLRTGSIRSLGNEGYGPSDHVWRADSGAMLYTAFPREGDGSVVFEHPVDGGAPRVLLESTDEDTVWLTGQAPDGSGYLTSHYTKNDANLGWLPAGAGESQPLLATAKSEDLARLSPDMQYVAYESTESGRQEVWLARFVADEVRLAEKWRVSQDGGKDPIWSPDGTELYYEDATKNLLSVSVGRDSRGEPVLGAATLLFDLGAMQVSTDGDQSYDVSPDGDEWIFIRTGTETATEVRVVLDWFAELERLVEAGG